MPDANMMKAAVLKEYFHDHVIEEIPIPKPGYKEVLVKVMASALCASDMHIQDGKLPTVRLPFVPGHEMAGIVYELGEGCEMVALGDHVVSRLDIPCGTCRFCKMGRTNICRSLIRLGFERNGSLEQFCAVPEENLIVIKEDLPFEQAAVIPDAIACMYHTIKNIGKVRAGDKICIMGIGGLGLHGVQIAKYFGADVISTSRKDEKLALAQALGSEFVVNTAKENLIEAVRDITDGEMCDVVFDNIGIQDSIADACRICRPGGTVVVVGFVDTEFVAPFEDMAMNEKRIVGARASTKQDLREAVRLVERGIVKPCIHEIFPLDRLKDAMDVLREGEAMGRCIILPWAEE